MPTFISKRIEKSFGEILRAKRKSLGYSLKEVAQILKIKLGYLRALEEEDFKKLPPPVYVQGFLKHYARFLKLAQEVVLKRYKLEQDILENLNKRQSERLVYQSKIKPNPLLSISPRLLKIVFIILGLIIFFIYLGWEISGFSSPPFLSIISPPDNKRINTDSLMVTGKTDRGAEVFINGQKIFIDPEGNFREQIVLSEGLNILEILARNKLGRERKEERKILVSLPSPSESSLPREELEEGEKNKALPEIQLIIKIKNSATWISVDTDGVNVFQGTMLPDTSQDFKAKEKITLTSGKAGNTYIIFNGKDLGNLGEPGEVVRDIEFTRELKVEELNKWKK